MLRARPQMLRQLDEAAHAFFVELQCVLLYRSAPIKRLVNEPVDLPETDKDATPMERLEAFARHIVHVPKSEIE